MDCIWILFAQSDDNLVNKKLPVSASHFQDLQSHSHQLVHWASYQWNQPTKNYNIKS